MDTIVCDLCERAIEDPEYHFKILIASCDGWRNEILYILCADCAHEHILDLSLPKA